MPRMISAANDAMSDILHGLARRGERTAADTARDVRNLGASTRLLLLVLAVSATMGIVTWAFLTSLDAVTSVREAHPAVFALLPAVCVITAWLYRNHGMQSRRGNNLVKIGRAHV